MKQSAFRKAVAGLLGIFTLGCILAMTLVIIVDPFFHYHKPLKGFPYLIDNQLSQNPGMAEHMEYDSVILGSSMTVNFQTDWFKELMGLLSLIHIWTVLHRDLQLCALRYHLPCPYGVRHQ